jgi:DNA-directed RNA polymerase specialized sigma24 family protein
VRVKRSKVEFNSEIAEKHSEGGATVGGYAPADTDVELQHVEEGLKMLPGRLQAVLLANAFGCSNSHIAMSFGLKPDTVKKYLTQARAKLSKWLQENAGVTSPGGRFANSSGEEP